MKISISYPPLESNKGIPLLSQNRQFQWFSEPTYIYPMVPAYAATLLKANGYEVFWDDGIAEGLTYDQWFERIGNEKPDIIVIETKTPVVKRHWQIIKDLKNLYLNLNLNLNTVLIGDHVTALPEESMQNSPVDFILTGGDYDFLLLNLCNHLSSSSQPQPQPPPSSPPPPLPLPSSPPLPVPVPSSLPLPVPSPLPLPSPLPSSLPPGIYYRQNGQIKNTGSFQLDHDLNRLPFIDRELTRWKLYAYKNGNFKYTPGTYMMSGRDCWWGRCKFCSWTTLYPGNAYRTFTVERQLEEVGRLIKDLKVREIFDDSGCFPKGEWLKEFCQGVIKKAYHKQVIFGCNMRVGALSKEEWKLMKLANFRFILIGLESVAQSTLNRLDKGISVEQIEQTVCMAKEAGLEPHITTMVGYPWETKEDADKTIAFARSLFSRGLVDTLQATIVVPYPGTPMFEEARQEGWLLTEDWDHYDMKQSVWNSPVSNQDVLRFTQGLYKSALNPRFIIRKVVSIRDMDDIKFLYRAAKKVFAHITDFKKKTGTDVVS